MPDVRAEDQQSCALLRQTDAAIDMKMPGDAGRFCIRLAPPLVLNEHEADIALDIFEDCVAQVESERPSKGKA